MHDAAKRTHIRGNVLRASVNFHAVDYLSSIESALDLLHEQLGDEGRFVLNSLAHTKDKKDV